MRTTIASNMVWNELIGKGKVIGYVKNTGQYIVAVENEWYSLPINRFENPLHVEIPGEGYLYYQRRKDRDSWYFSSTPLPKVQREGVFTKKFFHVPCDLYILREDVIKMEQGHSAFGYKQVPEQEREKYERITKHAFLPITREHIIDLNTFNVVFIFK